MDFPQYRKYNNDQSYFKITGYAELEEIKLLGRFYQHIKLQATMLPDRNFISDLLNDATGNITEITEQEFQLQVTEIINNKELLP